MIIENIIETTVSHNYVLITFIVIIFIVWPIVSFIDFNNKESETAKFKSLSEYINRNTTGEICNNPEKNALKSNYSEETYLFPGHHNGESFDMLSNLEVSGDREKTFAKNNYPVKGHSTPGYYNSESSARLNNPVNYELKSYDYHKKTYKSNLQFESSKKGDKFERYVAERFNDELFSIVEWTTDMSRKHNRFVESDCNPDLVIRDRKTNQIFCVECKYRSHLVNGYFDWSYPRQVDRYFSYARERNIPFYAVLGLGGTPDFPSKIFCVPLEEAKNPQIHISILQKYHHNPRGYFLWADRRLK